ncbi:MAG: hypothetical protein IAF02_03830 [Anaerolineae bacterium]|nr:hypothetical protein [Anaerolineae bacterium]
MKNNGPSPIACDLTVFSADTRQQLAATVPAMFQAVQRLRELSDGYALQFPNEPGMFMTLANFVEHERQCCPFYNFTLEVEANGGPLWLHLTGRADVKEFIQTIFQDLHLAVANGLIQTGSDADLAEIVDKAAPVLAHTIAREPSVE